MAEGSSWLRRVCVLGFLGVAACQPPREPKGLRDDTAVEPPTPERKASPQPGLDFSVIGEALALPEAEQIVVWQSWASNSANEALQEQATRALSLRDDGAGLGIFFQGLVHGNRRLRVLSSRALMELGPKLSTAARDALLHMLAQEPDDSAGALAWPLVLAGDTRVYDRAVDLFRKRQFWRVQYFDGRFAADAAAIGSLNVARTLALARDRDPEIRRLVAATCSRISVPECGPLLVAFSRDPHPEVRVHAIPGLAKLRTRESLDTLNRVLQAANAASRKRYLESLRDEAGLLGLVMALYSVASPESNQVQMLEIFELIDSHASLPRRSMLDPRGADALSAYIDHAQVPTWRFRAATVLAMLGDLRALPVLAERIREAPARNLAGVLTTSDSDADEDARALATRLIADLADLHTESLPEIRRHTESAILSWLPKQAVPHPDGIRALVKMDSKRGTDLINQWSKPTASLTSIQNGRPLDPQWPRAQAALRYMGRVRGGAAIETLKNMLQKRPQGWDLSAAAASRGTYGMQGLALTSLAIGAAQGLSEASQEPTFELLFRYAMNRLENERSRTEACRALAYTSNSLEAKRELLARAKSFGLSGGDAPFELKCLLLALGSRTTPELEPDLLATMQELMTAGDFTSAYSVALALGRAGISGGSEATLVSWLRQTDAAAGPATLALLLGGRPELATLAALRLLGRPSQLQSQVQQFYFHGFDSLSEEDLERETIFRWVRNARSIEQFSPRGVHLKWAWELLGQQLRNLEYDTGPHSLTRAVLRNRLYQLATMGDRKAVDTLLLTGERGMLFAMRDTQGPLSYAAYRAYFRFLPAWQNLGVVSPSNSVPETSRGNDTPSRPISDGTPPSL